MTKKKRLTYIPPTHKGKKKPIKNTGDNNVNPQPPPFIAPPTVITPWGEVAWDDNHKHREED